MGLVSSVELMLCLHHVHVVVLMHLVELVGGTIGRNLLGLRLGGVLDCGGLEFLRNKLLAV